MNIRNFEIEPIYVVKDYLKPDWSWISDTNGWTGFHLWYLFQNRVRIKMNQEEYILSKGETFLFDLSQNHHCTHDPQKPAGMFTAYFHCKNSELLHQLIQNRTIPRQNAPALFHMNLQLFEQAVQGTNTKEETEMWLAPVFSQILSPLQSNEPRRSVIAEICRQMDMAPQEIGSLDVLAKRCGYSKNQFIRLFKQMTGQTPHAHLVNARIARAKHLLLFSDYTVTQIARDLGYHDINHFSAQFYQKTGVYPSQYALQTRR